MALSATINAMTRNISNTIDDVLNTGRRIIGLMSSFYYNYFRPALIITLTGLLAVSVAVVGVMALHERLHSSSCRRDPGIWRV